MTAVIKLLLQLGVQSLLAHRTKSLIVGGLLAFGTFLVVTSLAVLDSVTRATRASLVESIAGDVQIYSKDAKDSLALLGGIGFGTEDIGEIDSYGPVRDAVLKVDNVAGVVPMGIANAAVASPGDLDRTLNALREAVKGNDAANVMLLADRVRTIARVLQDQQQKQAAVAASENNGAGEVLARALSDELWAGMTTDPLATLDWLDTKLAPLGEQGNQFYLRLVGTDLDGFKQTFKRIKIVDGEYVPSGTRGVLVGQAFLDRRLKFAVAMHLDTIHNELVKGQTIAANKTLQDTLAKARRASPRLVYMLPPKDLPVVTASIAAELGKPPGELAPLLVDFLTMDDTNFERRYQMFYDVIAARVQLYPFQVGDTITLTSFTKSGYLRSINVKVWGIYVIEGLESSDIASALSITDLMTFRELYGRRTAALDAELVKMKAASGAKEVNREDAEAALFGGSDAVEVQAVAESAAEVVLDKVDRQESFTFDPKDANEGFALTTAVLLKDPDKARATQREISAAVAPLGLQAVNWQTATGIVGQLTMVVSGVLLGAIFILFLVTTVILNNSLVMATLERVAEIGTLRAIGAQKRFVNAMITFETATLGALAGVVGALTSVLFITWLSKVGIPAPADVLQVLFGGPRLYPTLTASNVVAGVVATLIVGVFATLYPARLAMRVQPVVAMQGKE
ncbi:MAG: ABC transporter permease [Deltaproteobacteria bacterium]|nr:ABC transporter permease [Deltaproteobacteria bacterium]